MPGVRFVFDQHVNGPAMRQLRDEGVDVVHVAEAGLAEADDAVILAWAAGEGRIVVTRNYRDFAPLAEAYVRKGVAFAGVLFFSRSVLHSDTGHHVRALRDWIRDAERAGVNPVENGVGWLH